MVNQVLVVSLAMEPYTYASTGTKPQMWSPAPMSCLELSLRATTAMSPLIYTGQLLTPY